MTEGKDHRSTQRLSTGSRASTLEIPMEPATAESMLWKYPVGSLMHRALAGLVHQAALPDKMRADHATALADVHAAYKKWLAEKDAERDAVAAELDGENANLRRLAGRAFIVLAVLTVLLNAALVALAVVLTR